MYTGKLRVGNARVFLWECFPHADYSRPLHWHSGRPGVVGRTNASHNQNVPPNWGSQSLALLVPTELAVPICKFLVLRRCGEKWLKSTGTYTALHGLRIGLQYKY
jgi:hypothetical protein